MCRRWVELLLQPLATPPYLAHPPTLTNTIHMHFQYESTGQEHHDSGIVKRATTSVYQHGQPQQCPAVLTLAPQARLIAPAQSSSAAAIRHQPGPVPAVPSSAHSTDHTQNYRKQPFCSLGAFQDTMNEFT
ncbi:hypothetical protein AALO_G00079030 [Alosa alosa]|uniref:Uncharacterized protein n=1 Tax=Alosa alosa TaxID=278164 RepID=A0AAV6GWQ3_9TELE|nr:hypothetical protein AALO_G00079030 [Alosa alosa]